MFGAGNFYCTIEGRHGKTSRIVRGKTAYKGGTNFAQIRRECAGVVPSSAPGGLATLAVSGSPRLLGFLGN